MKTEKEFELLGKAIDETEDPDSKFAGDFRKALINEFAKEGITEEMLFGGNTKRKKMVIIRPDLASSLRGIAEASKGIADAMSKVSSAAMDSSISASQVKKKPHGPPFEVTYIDSEITASDEELLAYFRGIMLQKRIDRMDLIERMTHAAASLSGNTPEEELALFHAALRNNGFDFNKALISYLS